MMEKSNSLPKFIRLCDDGSWTLSISAQPNAPKTEIKGVQEDSLKVKIKSPPVEGKANEELIKWLADLLGIRRSEIELISGEKGRKKVLKLHGRDLLSRFLAYQREVC